MGYRPSAYNHFVTLNDGREAVFNTCTCGLFVLNEEGKSVLGGEKSIEFTQDVLGQYVDAGLVVDEEKANEYELLLYHELSSMYQEKRCFYEVLPTTGCNARCFYCFEEGVKPKRMDAETAEATARFIAEHNEHKEYVHLNWFGGEPLLNVPAIDCISDYLRSNLDGVELHAEMTTNGSLFSSSLIERARDSWALKKVQITLDGERAVHLSRKRYIAMPDAFERTLDNIETLAAAGIHVTIRLNVDDGNLESLVRLIETLSKRFGGNKNIGCYAFPLFDCGSCFAPDAPEKARLLVNLAEALVGSGLVSAENAFGLRRRETQCFARNSNGFLIAPDGTIYKCSQVIDVPREAVGSVFEGVSSNAAFLRWTSPHIPAECKDCVFFPLCLSGCKAGELGYGSVRHYIYRNVFDDVIRAYAEML